MTARDTIDHVSRMTREQDLDRVLIETRVRRAARRVADRALAMVAEYLRLLTSSIVGYWILTALIARATGADPLYLLAGIGILLSAQATSYKLKLAADPDFEIRGCGCGGGRSDGTATVLASRRSEILGIPNSVLALGLYAGLLGAFAAGHAAVALGLAAVATAMSAYLGYIMVVRLASLCATCINVAALNTLILGQLVI